MKAFEVRTIGILGSGICLDMAAALLAKNLGVKNVSIIAVNVKSDMLDYPVESTGPEISPICEMLNLNLRDLVTSANGSFRLGTSYTCNGVSWFVPFGSYGLDRGESGIDQAILKYLSMTNSEASLDDFSLAAQAAKQSRFAIAGAEREELKNALDYGVNLEAGQYSKYLRSACKKMGVRYVDVDKVSKVILDNGGYITKVLLGQDENITADFWIDISDNSILTREVSHGVVKQRDSWLTGDVSYFFSSEGHDNHVLPAVDCRRTSWGWLKVTDIQTQTIYEASCNEEQINRVEVERSIESITKSKIRFLGARHHDLGWLSSVWNSNCLSLGNPAVDFAGVVFSELSFVQAAIVAFLDFYPAQMPCPANIKWFNKSWNQQVLDARDYCALHAYVESYGTNDNDGLFPQELIERIKLFRRLGKVEEPESDVVLPRQWMAFFHGVGLRPELFSLSLNKIDDNQLISSMEKLRSTVAGLAKGMPGHKEFVSRYFS